MRILRVEGACVLAAAEAAEMILRVDDIIKCAPKRGNNKVCWDEA